MINLHERLSEFSYGYGVTREAELLLEQVGVSAVPFLPSLVQEDDLGFDVAFDRPGAILMLQFKLGQSLKQFRRSNLAVPAPPLDRPFWRFSIDTAEPDGQFETLLKAEQDGAEVYYVAPRFSDWPHYATLFENREVLDNSVMVSPTQIRAALSAQGAPDGHHRIVYDRYRVHVCSEPRRIEEVDAEDAVAKIVQAVRGREESVGSTLERVFKGFNDRSSLRRQPIEYDGYEQVSGDIGYRATGAYARGERERRLKKLLERANSREQAVAAAVGIELWTLGIQLVVAVEAVTPSGS